MLNPNNNWKYGITDEDSYNALVIKGFISIIRLSSIDKFTGLSSPLKFKNTTNK